MREVEIDLPEKLEFLFQPSRYKCAYGGRGGAKSWGFARAILLQGAQRKIRVLCAREFQNSIQDSVHKLLRDQIHQMGLDDRYEVQKAAILGKNGTEIIFSGIKNDPNKIKSMEGIDICWVEEAAKVSEESWEILIPTIRKSGSEIWISFNPEEMSDPTYQRFVVNPPPGCVSVPIGWADNPWLPSELKAERDYLYRVDPEAAAHVWGGECRRINNAQVLRGRYVIQHFEPRLDLWDGPYQGADWGFATDPSVLVRCWVFERTLYIEREAYGIGVEIDLLPALFDQIPDARKYTIRADSSRPETISYMQRNGFRIQPVNKWSGSVEDGVEHLRSYEKIVIHPEAIHAAEEAKLYSFKIDRLTGDILPQLVDKHNHVIDGIRYALEPVIRGALKKPIARPQISARFVKSTPNPQGWMG